MCLGDWCELEGCVLVLEFGFGVGCVVVWFWF